MESKQLDSRTHLNASLLSLPVEVRTMIYEYCLCVNIPIQPVKLGNAFERFGATAPTVAILSVCKSINEEAAAVFYGKNTWLMAKWGSLRKDPCPSIWQKHAALFRHVVVHCGRFEASEQLIHHLDHRYPELFISNKDVRFRVWEHVMVRHSLKECFSRKLALAMNMPSLKSFEVIFDTAQGRYFECRTHLVEHIMRYIRSQAQAINDRNTIATRTWRIQFVGRDTEEEKDILHGLDDLAPQVTWTLRMCEHIMRWNLTRGQTTA